MSFLTGGGGGGSPVHHGGFFVFLAAFNFLSLLTQPAVLSQCTVPPVIFNFGDSNSDTGGLVAGIGFPVNPPNGRVFFGTSTGRFSDGRLIIDFLCQSLNTSFLRAYMDSLGSNTFSNGANFAVAGSTTLPRYVPFALNIQLQQFIHFKARSSQLVTAGGYQNLITDEGFRKALYVIDIGQNDIADSFSKNLTLDQVVKRIPSVISEIKNAINVIYEQSGRNFWVHNTGPLGCLPQKLSMVGTSPNGVDQHGCLSSYNTAARIFNQGLSRLCDEMRSELKGATIVYIDIFAIKYDLIANSTTYGFSNPFMTCCGFGGPPYNYNIKVPCGVAGSQVCSEGSKYISWDGIHYTEAANTFTASRILSTTYSTPRTSFDFFCHEE